MTKLFVKKKSCTRRRLEISSCGETKQRSERVVQAAACGARIAFGHISPLLGQLSLVESVAFHVIAIERPGTRALYHRSVAYAVSRQKTSAFAPIYNDSFCFSDTCIQPCSRRLMRGTLLMKQSHIFMWRLYC